MAALSVLIRPPSVVEAAVEEEVALADAEATMLLAVAVEATAVAATVR